MNHDKYLALRRKYNTFEYTNYQWSADEAGLHLCFTFTMGEVVFRPTAVVARRAFLDFDIPTATIDRIVFEIGMAELVSYWKCACAPQVMVRCGSLGAQQIAFWKKLYWHGLGEFFYTNGINTTFEDFMHIECERDACALPTPYISRADAYLVPIGGGKDSVVSLELLREARRSIRPLIMNPRGATVECARVAGFDMQEVLVIHRTIDPELLRLNAEGYLNGHTPFSAMLAFYTLLASALSGVKNVALSNESSANESTVLGSSVNHQYSKGIDFENDYRHYVASVVGEGSYRYFSFLRPLTELQIAMLFSRHGQYHGVFRSCNVGSKQDVWCGHCAKCLFAYIILSPYIPPEQLRRIFGKDMLADQSLASELQQLMGLADTKPFECVGTVAEVHQALAMAIERWYTSERPALIADYTPHYPPADTARLAAEHNLSPDEFTILQRACSANNN